MHPMRLTALEPQFVKQEGKGFLHVDSLEQAQGILFLCPFCYQKNGGDIGTHSVLVWFRNRGVIDEEHEWIVSGTGYNDLTLQPSIDLTQNTTQPCWHGFVTGGEVT
jgi:hypothetical protein